MRDAGTDPGGPDLRLQDERWGSGPPALFLHGIGGSARYWRPLAAASSGYRGVAVDLLGFGRSPRPDGASYDLDCHLEALLPSVPPGSVVLAHSTGAVLAGALAVRRPDLVRALLLVGAPLYADRAEAEREVGGLGYLARVTATGEVAGRVACAVLHGLVKPVSRHLPTGLPDAVVRDFWEHDWRSYSRTLRRVVIGHPLVPDLREVAVPCTLLHGWEDRTASRRPLPDLVDDSPLLRAVEVAGDHHVAVRRPQVVADALGELLAAMD